MSSKFPEIPETVGSEQFPGVATENQLNEVLFFGLHVQHKLRPAEHTHSSTSTSKQLPISNILFRYIFTSEERTHSL